MWTKTHIAPKMDERKNISLKEALNELKTRLKVEHIIIINNITITRWN